MHDESGADALTIRQEREKLHPARIDADERLVGCRWQARNRPVVTLGLARDRNAVFAVEPQNLQDLLCLWPAKELLEPGYVLEPLLQTLRTVIGVAGARLA